MTKEMGTSTLTRNNVAGLTARFEEVEDEEMFNEVYSELAEKAAEAQATFEMAKKYEARQ